MSGPPDPNAGAALDREPWLGADVGDQPGAAMVVGWNRARGIWFFYGLPGAQEATDPGKRKTYFYRCRKCAVTGSAEGELPPVKCEKCGGPPEDVEEHVESPDRAELRARLSGIK